MIWRCILASVVLVLATANVRAADGVFKPSEVKTKDAVQAVISQQLDAFRSDNYAAAYGFADDAIKGQFPLADFEEMVRMIYPAIAHSASVSYGLTLDNGEEAVVSAVVVGKDQKAFSYQYILHRTGAAWRIVGVLLSHGRSLEV